MFYIFSSTYLHINPLSDPATSNQSLCLLIYQSINLSLWVVVLYSKQYRHTNRQTHLTQMKWKLRCKANQVVWSPHFVLGLLILDNSEKSCLPQAISAAKEQAVFFFFCLRSRKEVWVGYYTCIYLDQILKTGKQGWQESQDTDHSVQKFWKNLNID